MFDENSIIPFGPLAGKKLSEIDDRMELRNWLVFAPQLCKTQADVDLLNHVGRFVDEEEWVPYKMKAKAEDTYVVPFGKFCGMPLSKIPRNELNSYVQYLEATPTTEKSRTFLAKTKAYLAATLN